MMSNVSSLQPEAHSNCNYQRNRMSAPKPHAEITPLANNVAAFTHAQRGRRLECSAFEVFRSCLFRLSSLITQDITSPIRPAICSSQSCHAILEYCTDRQIGIATNTHGSTAYIATCETAAHLLLGHLNAHPSRNSLSRDQHLFWLQLPVAVMDTKHHNHARDECLASSRRTRERASGSRIRSAHSLN